MSVRRDHTYRVCRACDGDGYIMADSDTPQRERLTRDSRRCPYCNGAGRVLSTEAANV